MPRQPATLLEAFHNNTEDSRQQLPPGYIYDRAERDGIVEAGLQRLQELVCSSDTTALSNTEYILKSEWLWNIGAVDLTYFATRPEHVANYHWASPSLAEGMCRQYVTRMSQSWSTIASSRSYTHYQRFVDRGIVGPPPFSLDRLPVDVQRLWSMVEATRESRAQFVVDLPDEIREYLDSLNSPMDTMEAVELVYRRFLHSPCDPFFIEQAVDELGAMGDVAVRLQIMLMRHAQMARDSAPTV